MKSFVSPQTENLQFYNRLRRHIYYNRCEYKFGTEMIEAIMDATGDGSTDCNGDNTPPLSHIVLKIITINIKRT